MAATLAVVAWEGFAATAPLVGSDALHYHFTVPLEILRNGFKPNFFLIHAFLLGQSHSLVLAGLSLGSEKLALALVWLGGVLTAVTAASIGRLWLSRRGAWLVLLAFVLNPIAFWQMTSAGSPDLWMGLFLGAAVLVLSEASENVSIGIAVAGGILAGGLAGAKYTGCIFAGVLLVVFVMETRSMWKAAVFFVTAAVAGCWPYLRNFRWTGDPVFPYALSWFAPEKINQVALEAMRETTGASGHRDALRLIKFLFFAALDPEHFNFSQFFGPLLLVFVPLFLLLGKRTPMWRVTVIIWGGSSLAIGATTGMLRFLLPIFGIALAAAIGGAAELWKRNWRVARALAAATIGLFLMFGLVSLIGYSAPAMTVSLGLVSREEYLRKRAPDYALSEFLNDELGKSEAASHGDVLVFFRHLYYIRVPFLNGEPKLSWAVDPDKLKTGTDWKSFLRENHIGFVLRAPEYPWQIAGPLQELEAAGTLDPVAHREVSVLEGYRLKGTHRTVTATLLRVRDDDLR